MFVFVIWAYCLILSIFFCKDRIFVVFLDFLLHKPINIYPRGFLMGISVVL